jgi:single-strand DNA-binding protein
MTNHKNEVHLHGSLAKDPLIKYTPTGKCVANLTILTKYEQYTEFHRVVAWEKLAENAEKLHKGDFVKVVGRLQTRSWDDKQTRQKRYATEIVAFQLVIPGDEPAPLTPDAIRQKPAEAKGKAIAKAILSPTTPNIHGLKVTDDDIPW